MLREVREEASSSQQMIVFLKLHRIGCCTNLWSTSQISTNSLSWPLFHRVDALYSLRLRAKFNSISSLKCCKWISHHHQLCIKALNKTINRKTLWTYSLRNVNLWKIKDWIKLVNLNYEALSNLWSTLKNLANKDRLSLSKIPDF